MYSTHSTAPVKTPPIEINSIKCAHSTGVVKIPAHRDEEGGLLAARERGAHGHGLRGRGRLVQQACVADLHARQVGDHRLEIQQALQPPLRDLRLRACQQQRSSSAADPAQSPAAHGSSAIKPLHDLRLRAWQQQRNSSAGEARLAWCTALFTAHSRTALVKRANALAVLAGPPGDHPASRPAR